MAISFTKEASIIWRDYITDGVPASGPYSPVKGDIRTWGTEVQNFLRGTSALDAVDIDGGSVDNTPIGATTASTGKFTTLESTGAATLASLTVSGALNLSTTLGVTDGGTGGATAAAARTNLGLEIGADVQAYSSNLTGIAGFGSAADRGIYTTGVGTYSEFVLTSVGRALLGDASVAAQRATLGLGSAAVENVGTGADNVVQLDGAGKLPAVDGSQLTNLSSSLVFLEKVTASASAVLQLTAFDNTQYDYYLFVLSSLVPSASARLVMQSSTDGGASYDSTAGDYDWIYTGNSTTAAVFDASSAGAETTMRLSSTVLTSGDGISGRVEVFGAHQAAPTNVEAALQYENSSSAFARILTAGRRVAAADVDAVQFLFESGNITSGTITMYGAKNA